MYEYSDLDHQCGGFYALYNKIIIIIIKNNSQKVESSLNDLMWFETNIKLALRHDGIM